MLHKNDDIAQGAVEGVLLVGFRCQRRKMAARSTHMINWPPLTTSTTATMAMMMVMILKVYPHDILKIFLLNTPHTNTVFETHQCPNRRKFTVSLQPTGWVFKIDSERVQH